MTQPTDAELLEAWYQVEADDLDAQVVEFYRSLHPPRPETNPIWALNLSVAITHALLRSGVDTVERLRNLGPAELLSLRGIGAGRISCIRKALAEFY